MFTQVHNRSAEAKVGFESEARLLLKLSINLPKTRDEYLKLANETNARMEALGRDMNFSFRTDEKFLSGGI